MKEYRRHGEAGSVVTALVEEERKRLQELLRKYPLRDIFNCDETGLFGLYVPLQSSHTRQADNGQLQRTSGSWPG